MKTFLLSLIIISSFSTITIPVLAQTTTTQTAPPLDYSGLVKCDGVVTAGEDGRKTPCDFNALISTVNSIISYMFYISIPIAAVLFAYAGFLYITGVPGNINKAKSIFTSVGIGFIIMLTAWIAVYSVVNWFIAKDPTTGKDTSGATTLIQVPK